MFINLESQISYKICYLQLENLIQKNYFLNQSGKDAFKSFIRAYDSHQLKTIFSLAQLDLQQVAKSFGFTQPPAVDLSEFAVCLLQLNRNFQ